MRFLLQVFASRLAYHISLIDDSVMDISPDTKSLAPRTAAVALVPLGVLLNLGIGTLVHVLKLPVFLDAVGTILITILIGIRWGAVTGVLSFLVGGVLVNPVLPWFSGTQAVIAVAVGVFASRGFFRNAPRTILTGIVVGIAAGIVSAPIIIYLFGGITGSGSGVITAFLLASGKKILESVILTGVSCEPLDKTLQCLLAYWLIRSIPQQFRRQLEPLGYLRQNSRS